MPHDERRAFQGRRPLIISRSSLFVNTIGLGRLTNEGNKIVAGLTDLIGRLLSDQRDFDFLYEEALERGLVRCKDGVIAIGPNRYSTLIVPWATHIPASTLPLRKTLKRNGVNVIFVGGYPAVIDKQTNATVGIGITIVKDAAD